MGESSGRRSWRSRRLQGGRRKLSNLILCTRSRPIQVRKSRRKLRLCRRSPPPQPASPDSKEELPEAAASKILYMVMQYSFSPPITQALFAVDSSSSSYGTCHLQEVKNNPEIISPSLYPAVEFREGDFPMNMCFSMLGSKLYFFGGHHNPIDCLPGYTVFSSKVYCIDTIKHPLLPSTGDGCIKTKSFNAKSVVHEAPEMISGKPHCYGFVAYGKLYVIGTDVFPSKYTMFEYYDPARPEKGWHSLPGIPDREAAVDANAVVGHKVVFVTTSGMFSFNLKTLKWKYFYYEEPPQCRGAYGEAVVLGGNNIFWDRDYGVALLGPIVDLENDLPLIQCRNASGDFSEHLEILLPKNFPSARLHYMGCNVFSYVMLGDPPNPEFAHVDPDVGFVGNPGFCLCSIIVFQVPKEATTWPKLLPAEPLAVKVMYAKRFFCRSKHGANHSNIFLKGCFSAPLST